MTRAVALLITIFALITLGCARIDNRNPAERIIGKWKLLGMTREPFPLDKITETDLIGGHITFNEDKSLEGEIVYPKMLEKNVKFVGTYSVENATLTINNKTNSSTTQSTLKFEQDLLIATPETPGGFIAYYKRAD